MDNTRNWCGMKQFFYSSFNRNFSCSFSYVWRLELPSQFGDRKNETEQSVGLLKLQLYQLAEVIGFVASLLVLSKTRKRSLMLL